MEAYQLMHWLGKLDKNGLVNQEIMMIKTGFMDLKPVREKKDIFFSFHMIILRQTLKQESKYVTSSFRPQLILGCMVV